MSPEMISRLAELLADRAHAAHGADLLTAFSADAADAIAMSNAGIGRAGDSRSTIALVIEGLLLEWFDHPLRTVPVHNSRQTSLFGGEE